MTCFMIAALQNEERLIMHKFYMLKFARARKTSVNIQQMAQQPRCRTQLLQAVVAYRAGGRQAWSAGYAQGFRVHPCPCLCFVRLA